MVKVLFDHQTFSMQRYGGISRYFSNIHAAIGRRNDVSSSISVLKTSNNYIQNYPSILNNFVANTLFRKQKKCYKWNGIYSNYRIKKGDFDILHPTYYDPYFIKHTKKPYVITVHDMIHELFPQFFDSGDTLARQKRLCIENAAHIIVISQTTKEDLKRVLGIEDNRISVIYHGFDPQLTFPDTPSDEVSNGDYLLFVGDRRGYKNFSIFVTAITPLLHENPSLRLICAGGGAFQSAEQELLLRLKIQQRVYQTNVSDMKLSMLYKNAMAFIYPSLYEGFGLPLLEAFQNNCPIIASGNSCFKEVGADAVKYFDPYSKHSISTTIQEVINSPQLIKTLVTRGQQQLLKFPMNDCMDQTIQVYKNLAQRNYL